MTRFKPATFMAVNQMIEVLKMLTCIIIYLEVHVDCMNRKFANYTKIGGADP